MRRSAEKTASAAAEGEKLMKLKKLSVDEKGNIRLDGQLLENVKEYFLKKETHYPAEVTLTMYVTVGEIAELEEL